MFDYLFLFCVLFLFSFAKSPTYLGSSLTSSEQSLGDI